jgi:broad specificity phosphatase PhoE
MRRTNKKATKILLIRHAEKPNDGSDAHGVTQKGDKSKESLNVRGWQRAGALALLLAPISGRFHHASLAKPQFLFASKPLRRKGSKRPIQTITPLADKLDIRIHEGFERSEYKDMLAEAFRCPGVVLICWQREYIPDIARHIVGQRKAVPLDWPEDRYDLVWVFDLDPASETYRLKQVPQKLLGGDLTGPIR